MKTQIVGFILFLFLCVLVPLGETTPAPYTVSYSGPSHIPPGGSGTFTFTVKKDGIPQSGVTMYIYRRPETKSSLSNETPVTDANGEAQMTLTLESAASGTYRITASAPDREGGKELDEDVDYVRFNVIVGDSPSPPTPTTNTGPLSEPMTLLRISGDNQQGLPGETLAHPFVVEVRNQDGEPAEGIGVTFYVLTGGGSLSAVTVTTDSNGRAESTLTLGSEPGINRVQISFSGINPLAVLIGGDSPRVVFSAEATTVVLTGDGSLSTETVTTDLNGQVESTPDPDSESSTSTVEVSTEATLPPPMPTTLVVSGDNQTGLTGEALTNPFVVEVRNQYGDPMAGVTATFAVITGGGTLSVTTTMTDANGHAESTLTLGSDPGTNTVDFSVEGIAEIVTVNAVAKLLEFDLSVPSGISLIHIPLKVRTVDGVARAIESVGDLYDALGGAATINLLTTYNPDTQGWQSYLGNASRNTNADKTLTDELGIIANMSVPVSIRLGGDALGVNGSSTITLNQGANLVGLPLMDSRITRVSDLFTLEGVADNVSTIVVSDNGGLKAVRQAGDDGDIPVTGGQSFLLTATEAAMVSISGDGWNNTSAGAMAAPPLVTGGIQVAGTTPVLALNGLIVDDVRTINSAGLSVSVKNLSTGSAVATVIGDMGSTSSQGSYRLTVVDIVDGRAAAIGDILEISVISPDASIGVEPLRYTVTAEDVRRSRIELPALFLQEIPRETELLRNYPNPFNPETWIPYRLAQDAFVTLTIYNGSGQVVRTLDIGHQAASIYESRSKAAYWDGRNDLGESVASGLYFYTLTAGDYSATRKMLILK